MSSDPASQRDGATRSTPRLLIVSDCAHGGTFHVATLLAEGLRQDFAISFVAPFANADAPSAAALRNLGIELVASALSYENLDRSTYARDEAADILDTTRPDLILSVDGAELSSLLAIKTVARRRAIPYVIIINLLSEDVRERFAPLLADSTEALRAAAAVVFVSEASRRRCERLLPDVAFPARVIANSVDDAFFEPADPAARAAIRQSFGIPDDTLLCLTAARIEQRKGQAIGVAALARLKAERGLDGLHWLLAGRAEDWDRGKLEEAASAAGVSEAISILGERSDIRALLDASDVFVLTSYAEGMPLSIIEALARGVPVIATAIDGIVEQVDETCGVLLPSPADDETACVEGLAQALGGLQKDRALLAGMGEAARRLARDLFHPAIGVAHYRSLLTEIAQRRPHRPEIELKRNPPLRPGMSLDFARPAQIWNHLQDGWARCEPDGIWTNGLASTMRIALDQGSTAVELRFELTPFAKRRKSKMTRVLIDGRPVATWQTRRGRQRRRIVIDADGTGRVLQLRFENPGATRPCDIGMGSDYRQLALLFHRLDVRSADTPTIRSRLNDRLRAWLGRPA